MHRSLLLKYLSLCILLFSCLVILMPHGGFHSDIRLWKIWSIYGFENGLGNVYGSHSNYLPLYHYILYVFAAVMGSAKAIGDHIYLLKGITLLFHFITGYFFIRFLSKTKVNEANYLFYVLFYLLSISVLYNSLIWGQVDAIMTCFVFVSVYYAYDKKGIYSLLFFTLALNMKLQAIVFFPIITLILVSDLIGNFKFRKLLGWIAYPLLLQTLILLPFILNGKIENVWAVIEGSIGHYPVVSMNAYNFWDLLLPGNLMKTPDSGLFLSISYKNWGLLLFFTLGFIALLPLFKAIKAQLVLKRSITISLRQVICISALIPLLFFYFNTQMHERYSHPAMVFLILYAVLYKRVWPAILGSIAYVLNLEAVLKFLKLGADYKIVVFNRDFISVLFLATILLLFYELINLLRSNARQSPESDFH